MENKRKLNPEHLKQVIELPNSSPYYQLLGIRIVQQTAKEFYYRCYSGFNTLVIRL